MARKKIILDEFEQEQFDAWMEDGNVIKMKDGYATQDAQYSNRLKDLDALKEYFYKEFIEGQYDSYAGGGKIETYSQLSKNYQLELDYKVGQTFDIDILGGTATARIKSISFKVHEIDGKEIVDENSYRIEYLNISDNLIQQSHFSFLNKLKKERNKINISVPYSIGSGIFFENSNYSDNLKLLNGLVNGFEVLYYGTRNDWFDYYVKVNEESYSVDSKDAYNSVENYIDRVSSDIKKKLPTFKKPTSKRVKVKLDYKIGQKIKIPIYGGFSDGEITRIEIYLGDNFKESYFSKVYFKNVESKNNNEFEYSYIDFEQKIKADKIPNELSVEILALKTEDIIVVRRYMEGSKLKIEKCEGYVLFLDKDNQKLKYLSGYDLEKEIFTSIEDFKSKIINTNSDIVPTLANGGSVIESFVNDMVKNQIARRTIKIKDKEKFYKFLKDIQPFIDKKIVRVQTNPIDDTEVWISLGSKSLNTEFAYGGQVNKVLFAVRVGKPDWAEELITENESKIEEAKEWAKKNGFDRFRIAEIDMSEKPKFKKGGSTKTKINKKYKYFAQNKENKKIYNGWELVDDVESLKHYAKLDLKDNDLKPSDFNIISAQALVRQGIDPFDSDNWFKIDNTTKTEKESVKVENQFDDAGTSMVMYHEKKGNFIVPKGQIYLWLYDVEGSANKLQSEEFDWVFYPHASLNMAMSSDFIPPLKRIWTKKFQKDHKGSEHLLGVIKAYLIDKENGEKELFVDMMSVNPKHKKEGIMSYMLKDLRETFNLTKDGVTFSQLTDEGKKFVNKKTYAYGGAVYPDLSLEKPAVVNDGETIKVPEFEIKKIKQDLYIKSDKVTSSSDAVNIFREIWNPDTINAFEQAYVLYLNKNNKVIGYYAHSSGGVDGTIMDVQMISGMALKSLSKGVIIAHNHPSDNTQPSDADTRITKQLKEGLKLFNIQLLDSIILTDKNYTSLADEGLM